VVSTDVGRGNVHRFGLRTRLWHGLWGRLVDGIVACCPAANESVSGRKLPVVQTYHAADSRVYQPVPARPDRDKRVVFAYLGQLVHRKGLDLLLDAAVKLRERGRSDFAIHFIGGGDDTWLRGCISQRGLEAHCELKGFLSGSAIREALGQTDAFVLPTRWDSYAAVVHEAACLGMPLLVSKHAGAAEALVREGVNGHTFDPDNTDAFAAAMAEMLDPAVRARMAPASREIGESHSAHLRGRALWNWLHDEILRAPERIARDRA
jgi:glycosyltransferase involved in cell wall biosynthesis